MFLEYQVKKTTYEYQVIPEWEDYYSFFRETYNAFDEPANLDSKQAHFFWEGMKAAVHALWLNDVIKEEEIEKDEDFVEFMKARYRDKFMQTTDFGGR